MRIVLQDEIGIALRLAWAAEDDEAFARHVTALCRDVWRLVRSDPFPDPVALAHHIEGVQMGDGEELLHRILSFGERVLQ
ncbi:hypothetical protein [Shimia aestuarii]|uniref:Uncharacterized protein n=1 Tax=Shimia aestuarii TaxID=254406 RepID=A0A1I4N5U6_9RHOB|nr:hypothetical protein [Shimia aestuarii]SFM10954.1 hypothetical protein SAMN04488042_1047 [Shimia aestuarii]